MSIYLFGYNNQPSLCTQPAAPGCRWVHVEARPCRPLPTRLPLGPVPAAEAEVTYGERPHGHLQLQAPNLEVLQMEALWATGGGAEPQQVQCVSSWGKLGVVIRHAETEFE